MSPQRDPLNAAAAPPARVSTEWTTVSTELRIHHPAHCRFYRVSAIVLPAVEPIRPIPSRVALAGDTPGSCVWVQSVLASIPRADAEARPLRRRLRAVAGGHVPRHRRLLGGTHQPTTVGDIYPRPAHLLEYQVAVFALAVAIVGGVI